MTRKETTSILTEALVYYFSHKTWSSHVEFGVLPWGRRRLDVMAISTKGMYHGIEVKSCVSDYSNDTKWKDYLPFVNKLSFCIPDKLWQNDKFRKRIVSDTKPHGVGIMILCPKWGHIKVVQNAKKRKMNKADKTRLIIKMAWRGGMCKRTIKQRKRLYLEE